MRTGEVYVNGFFAGVIAEEPGNGYSFVYDDRYYENPSLPAVSLTLPKTQKSYQAPYLFPFFANMLSEGSNRAAHPNCIMSTSMMTLVFCWLLLM